MIAGEQHEGKPEMLKPRAGEPPGARVESALSRSISKLDSASIGKRDWPIPSDLDEACQCAINSCANGWGSNEQAHLSESPGWLEAARGYRSVEEPGKPS